MAGLRDRVADAIGEPDADPRWAERLTDLLYDGESVVESVDLGDARVVVTSHRVLAFTPDADGIAFRQVDRPNVVAVTAGARTESSLLGRAGRWGVIGVVLLGAGLVLDMEALVGDVSMGGGAGSQIGVGGVLELVRTVLDLLGRLDEILAVAGVLVLALAGVAAVAYWLTRQPTFVIEVAGDDDVHLPRVGEEEAVRDRLATAVAPADARPEP